MIRLEYDGFYRFRGEWRFEEKELGNRFCRCIYCNEFVRYAYRYILTKLYENRLLPEDFEPVCCWCYIVFNHPEFITKVDDMINYGCCYEVFVDFGNDKSGYSYNYFLEHVQKGKKAEHLINLLKKYCEEK